MTSACKLTAQKKSHGRTAVEATLQARERYADQLKVFTRLQKEQDQLVEEDPSHTDLASLAVAVNQAWNDCEVAKKIVSQLECALGVNEKQELRGLEENPFLRVRMNALALKQRLRDRLRHRKFEMSRMERSYRHSVNGE